MRTPCALLSLGLLIAVGTLAAAEDPFADLERPKSDDPFADLEGAKPAEKKPNETPVKNRPIESKGFFEDNFTIKKEVYGAVTWSDHAAKPRDFYSRQSVGFEILKKFSTRSATVASFNVQGRLVRRDNFLDTPFDAEGRERDGFFFEYHNLYWDFYNVLNPVLGDAKGDHVGRFNFRLGRFYLPFGLNLQTDTHGSLLQLSNDRNFGFERDWYAGLWGSLNQDLNYDFYYLLGAGYDLSFKGQKGLVGTRVSLANKYSIEHGVEAGLAFLYGERLSWHALEHSASVERDSEGNKIVDTLRLGLDFRYTRTVPTGSLVFTNELSLGKDENDEVFTQLHQLGYLNRSRKFGFDVQYRRFFQNMILGAPSLGGAHAPASSKTDASVIGEFTWYFRNDLGNTNLHWIKVNVERETEYHQKRKLDTKLTVQYYRYW
ncbi:MAG: hypothetical protein KIS92_24815 [Planctomycetota bacterium]|nr:hypothetical protein [Planctomycetota bacterium]